MRKRYNLVRRLLDSRKHSKDGRIALAAYIGIKLDNTNSIHYGMTAKELQKYYRCGYLKAKTIRRIMQEEKELFSCNLEKNIVFANCCKSDEIKHSRGRISNKYRSDDVIVIDIPQCYLDKSGRLSLKELLLLVDRILILKEYDDGAKYKSNARAEKPTNCEKEAKSETYVSKATGISRTTLGRRLKAMVSEGVLEKTSEKHIERCKSTDKGAFVATNKVTRLPYYLKSAPVTFAILTAAISFTHIIWDAPKRLHSIQMKSEDRMRKEVLVSATPQVTNDELEFRLMVKRELERREKYD